VVLMCYATGLSQRRACRLTGLSLSICRYDAQRPAPDAHLSGRITELALERRRFELKAIAIIEHIVRFLGFGRFDFFNGERFGLSCNCRVSIFLGTSKTIKLYEVPNKVPKRFGFN